MDEETRALYEGYRPGVYVRLQVDNMPCEFIDNFDATYPIILGGLLSAEQNIGYVQVRCDFLGKIMVCPLCHVGATKETDIK